MKQENDLDKGTENPTCEVHELTITGAHHLDNCFPSLNDLLSAAERHPMAYNRIKRDMEWEVTRAIRRDLQGWHPTGRVALDIVWGEKSKGKTRDYDNVVAAGRKIINDALVKNKVIKDDNPVYLGYGNNEFVYTDKVFIKVTFREIEQWKI